MGWYFAFFFLSGFCSILYELIWLRLTMAQYGITTALVSITLSMFMLGMGIGSWGAGKAVRSSGAKGRDPLRFYALVEFLIGCSSLAVPGELILGHRLLESFAGNSTMSSGTYYLASGTLVALTLLPWCVCMGATYPLAMAAIEGDLNKESRRSFSYLYLSNVVGAFAGAIVPLLLIEMYGFHGTLRIGSLLNALIALSAFTLSFRKGKREETPVVKIESQVAATPQRGEGCAGPAVSHWTDDDGHGGDLDPHFHSVCRVHLSTPLRRFLHRTLLPLLSAQFCTEMRAAKAIRVTTWHGSYWRSLASCPCSHPIRGSRSIRCSVFASVSLRSPS